MGKLKDRMRRDMELKNFSPRKHKRAGKAYGKRVYLSIKKTFSQVIKDS